MNALLSLYGWHYASALVRLLQRSEYRAWSYLKTYWQTQNFSGVEDALAPHRGAKILLWGLRGGMFVQLVAGVLLLALWKFDQLAGGWQFGLALVLSYPIVWAHVAAVLAMLGWLARPKKLGRAIVCRILEGQVRKLRARNDFKIVAVVGSVGKTSTKAAIARTLEASLRVRWQEGNYNDRATVPLIFFGQSQPNILNAFAWLRIFTQNSRTLRRPYPYDIVVAELGSDGPGQLQAFSYLKPEIVVVTAITPEHMEYFGTLDAVAAEELSVLDFAEQALINIDDTPSEYLPSKEYLSYGLSAKATYYAGKRKSQGLKGQTATFYLGKEHEFRTDIPMLGDQGAKIAVAAAATASLLGMKSEDIEKGLQNAVHFAGRMQILEGIEDSTLIDDTYNATPIAVKAALDVLYKTKSSQRIAILGSMNELGDYAEEAHREVAEYCDPKKLDLIVTVGHDAERWIAPLAAERGCTIKSFHSPYDAGEFVKSELKAKAVVLAKGSQNGVFAEESLKSLLKTPEDASKLVRQSPYWLRVKAKQFSDASKHTA